MTRAPRRMQAPGHQLPIPETVTLRIPFRFVKRGGRKEMVLPSNTPPGAPQQRKADSTLIKALARAFRWKRMLDSGEFTTIAELAEREGIAVSYMTRVLRLTLLAPDIVEAILEGTQGPDVTLVKLMEPFPGEWEEQREGSSGDGPFLPLPLHPIAVMRLRRSGH